MICWFKQEKCSHLMPASLVYSKSVIECLLHCLLNIPKNIGYVYRCIVVSHICNRFLVVARVNGSNCMKFL